LSKSRNSTAAERGKRMNMRSKRSAEAMRSTSVL
jgi:hypothetical protein